MAILDLYTRIQKLAEEEERTPDSNLPDPDQLGLAASETEWGYNLWAIWRAMGKPPNVSALMQDLAHGYGGVIAMLLELESIYAKHKLQIEERKPKPHGNK